MPYRIVTKDGIVIDDIPNGVDKDDQRLKDTVAQLRAAGKKQASFVYQPQAEEPLPVPAKEKSSVGEFMEGAAKGLKEGTTALVRGAAQGVAGAVGVFSDPITALINQVLPEEYRGKVAREAVQDLLTKAGIPENETAAQRIVTAGAEGLAGAVTQTGAGQAIVKGASLAPSLAKRVGATLAAQPVQQAAGGIGAGVASQAAAESGAGAGVQIAAGLAGSVLGSGIGGAIAPDAVPSWSPQSQTVKAGEQAGIDVATSDVIQPKSFASKWLQSFGEKIPGAGTGGMRKAQQAQRVDAVRDIVRQYGAEDLAATSDDVMKDLLGKRSADLTKWSTAKNEVIDKLSEAGAALGEGAPKIASTVPMPKTVSKIEGAIESLRSLKTKEVEPVISVLSDWKEAIQGQNLKNVETLRKQIGEVFKAPELASVRSTGERVLSDVYASVKDDMTDYIRKAGGQADLNKWQVANRQLAGMMDELELPALKSAIDRGETTPEVINKLVFSKNKSDVEALFRNLSPDGRAAVRSSIIAKATDGMGDDVSPDKFATNLRKMGAQVGVFFGGEDLQQVKGLYRTLEATKRASQAALNPATGVQAVLPAGYAAMVAAIPGTPLEKFVGATTGMALAGGAARLYESKAVRDQLIKIANAKPGSEVESQLILRLLETMRAGKKDTGER